MKKTIYIIAGIALISLSLSAQNIRRAVPGEIETYIDRYSEGRENINKNGWAHYYIPKGMGDTLTVKMSCVYNGRQTHTPHTHNEDESFYIIQGPVNFHIDGEERILNTGDFVYTPSGTHHNIQRTNDIDTIKYLVIKRETVEAVDKPYVTSRPYTQNDCYNYAANHPEWSKRTEAADICLLDKNFAAGFRVTLERIVDNNDVKSREFPDEHGQVAIYVLEGEAEVTLNGQHALIGADNTFYCPKNSSFSLQKRGSAPFEYLAITTE